MIAPLIALCLLAAPAPRHAPTVDDLLAMERLSEPALSPDGRHLVFTLRATDLAANRGRTDLWLVGLDGQGLRRLTTHPENDWSPQWSPDGRAILFLSSRTTPVQVWRLDLAGGEPTALTAFPIDVDTFTQSPDGRRLVMAMEVYPELVTGDVLADTAARDATREADPVKARAYDELLFRHWDRWEDGKRSHVFVWDLPTAGAAARPPVDLMRGAAMDSPERPFGGGESIAVAPDGKTVAFVARNATRDAAWSTNLDVWLAPIDGSAAPVPLTADNLGADWLPTFSPDGKTLAVLSQARAGYESDKARVVLWDLGKRTARVLTDAWDRSAAGLAWSKDGRTLFTSADHLGHHALFSLDIRTGTAKVLLDKGTNHGVIVGKGELIFERDTLTSPNELWAISPAGKGARPITAINAARVAAIDWPTYEQYTFEGAHGDTVHGFVVKPAGLKDGDKRPVVLIVHGGPQGSMGDHFHYRWNPMAFAGRGFAVVFIDFHGSTGYGQAFTDAIRGDWGGAPYEDLMKGLDAALARYPYMDPTRLAAAGASYGGYMINWIHGQTDRFKALVCHDGNLDERFAYFDTEELWFPEWEHGGVPWEAREGFAKHNPIDHIDRWSTPTLVIHGALDFRVVDTQGMGTFTALQRKGIPSRFLHFPDENHWVLKPANSKRWHDEVLGWIERWTR